MTESRPTMTPAERVAKWRASPKGQRWLAARARKLKRERRELREKKRAALRRAGLTH